MSRTSLTSRADSVRPGSSSNTAAVVGASAGECTARRNAR